MAGMPVHQTMEPSSPSPRNGRHVCVKVLLCAIILPVYLPVVCLLFGGKCLWSQVSGKPLAAYCGNGSRSAQQEYAKQQEVRREEKVLLKEAPPPLPDVRKRSLTLPLPASKTRFWQKAPMTVDQLQSPLFGRFPFEVRKLIYKFYLVPDDHCLHIFRRKDKRLAHYLCTSEHGSHYYMPLQDWGYKQSSCTRAWQKDGQIHPEFSSNLLPLLKTCRRAYEPN